MAGFKVTLTLPGNSITLKKLTKNIINTHLNHLNDIFELLHKEEIKENLLYFENVYQRLLQLDVFQYYKSETVKTPLADAMAEFYESTKSTFVSKIDFITPLLLKTRGKKGIVTESLLNLLQKEKNEPIEYKKIIRLVKIHMKKENLAFFDTAVSEKGILTLKYIERTKYCLGDKYCSCGSFRNISGSNLIEIFEFTLKGEVQKPFWQMISPVDMPFPLGLLYPYIQKTKQVSHQKNIYQTYKNLCNDEKCIFSPNTLVKSDETVDLRFLDFTLTFWNASLRIVATKGTLKYKDFIYTSGLDICDYEKELTRLFDREIDRKWSYLGISKKIVFQIGTGIIFKVFDKKQHRETHIFEHPEDLTAFLSSFRTKQFYVNIFNILRNYTFESIRDYAKPVFGENNVMIRDQCGFIVVSSKLWIGKIIKFGLMRQREIFFNHQEIFSNKILLQNDIHRRIYHETGKNSPLLGVDDLNLLFLANELFQSQNVHFVLRGVDLEFVWVFESIKFEILIRSLKNDPVLYKQTKYLAVLSHNSHNHNVFIENLDELRNFLIFLVMKQRLIEIGIVLKEETGPRRDKQLILDENSINSQQTRDKHTPKDQPSNNIAESNINQNFSANQITANEILKSLIQNTIKHNNSSQRPEKICPNNTICVEIDQNGTQMNRQAAKYSKQHQLAKDKKTTGSMFENTHSNQNGFGPNITKIETQKMHGQQIISNRTNQNTEKTELQGYLGKTVSNRDSTHKDSQKKDFHRMELNTNFNLTKEHSTQNRSYSYDNVHGFSFMFYNLPIMIFYNKKMIFKSKNLLLNSLINNAVDKNDILLNLIVYLRAIKPIIKINTKPAVFTSNIIMFWFGKKIIFKFKDEKYYWNNQELENVAEQIKQMDLKRKISKMKKKLSKWCIKEDNNALYFKTDLGQFNFSTEKMIIKLAFTETILKKSEQLIIEKLFFNILNFEDDYLKYFDVLISTQKAESIINSLRKK